MKTQAILAVGAMLASFSVFAQSTHYSVIRMQMPDKYSLTSIQKNASAAACKKATADYVKEMHAKCPTCKVQSARCETALSGAQGALWKNDPLMSYSVSAGDTRLLLSGKADATRPACEQMAKELTGKGVAANCIAPGQARK